MVLLQNSLVIDTPRVRKQTRPFSATKDELAELSEGESSGDDKPKLRRPHDRLNSYGRTECFRVEKNLLVYGWVMASALPIWVLLYASTITIYTELFKISLKKYFYL